jgi:hypothetical protein
MSREEFISLYLRLSPEKRKLISLYLKASPEKRLEVDRLLEKGEI